MWRFLRGLVSRLHIVISSKSSIYSRWHEHPKHKKVHKALFHGHNAVWVVILITVLIQSVNTPLYAANLNQGVSLKEEWEQGVISNLDTEDQSGNIKLKASGEWGTRVLKTPPQTVSVGTAGVFYNGILYVLRGNSDNDFWAYSPTKNEWTALAQSPVGVGTGSHVTRDNAGNLYVIFGGYTKAFYKYTIASNTWTRLADISDVTGPQSSIIYAAGNIYLLRANNSQDFFVYDLIANEWNSSSILPNAAGNGAELVFDGGQYIYALRGNGAAAATAMYRFDIETPGWQLIVTTGMPTINWQTDVQYVSGSIYIQSGNSTTNFYKCTISGTTCPTSAITPFPSTTNSGLLAYNPADALLYSLRGNGTYDFWKFDPSTDTFVGPSLFGQPASTAPIGFTTGADLIYDGNAGIYGLKGGSPTSGFYYYDFATMSWSARTVTGLPTLSYDTKAIKVGKYIYLFQGNSTSFYRYDTTNDAGGWLAQATVPLAVRNGGSLAYPGTGDLIYAIRGNNSGSFYAYSITNNNWTTFDPADLPTGVIADVGAGIVATATDVYAIIGNGNTAFYKYNILGDSWTQIGRLPFSPYYGTDITVNSGKIYALAGNYSFSTYEYDGGAWRRLQDLPKYSQASPFYYDAGAYRGASIEAAGSYGIFVERGNGASELLYLNQNNTKYLASGTYESPVFDLTYVTSWNSLTKTVNVPTGASLAFETNTSDNGSIWNGWSAVVGDTITSQPGRFIKVKIVFNSTADRLYTPTVSDFNISYVSDEGDPVNPTSMSCYSAQVGGDQLTSESPYRYDHPFCSWTGAIDNESGIAGYYVYAGTDPNADPANLSTGSFFVATSNALLNNLDSNGNNYIRIKTKDNAGNVSDDVYQGFVYNYVGVAPLTSITKTLTSDFTGTLEGLSANNNQLKLNSKEGFWKESRLTPAPTTASSASMVTKGSLIYYARGGAITIDSYDINTDTWNTATADLPVALAAGGSIVDGPGNYIYAIRGGAQTTQNFYRFDGSAWTDLSAAAPIPGTISTGSTSVYDGSRYIYVMRGNSDDGFYRYDTQGTNGQWTTRSNINFGYPNQTNSVAPTTGSSMAYDGNDTIYAIQGAYAGGFAKYTISTNIWTPLDLLPMIPGAGASLNWDLSSSSLIFIPGNNSNKMYHYSPASGQWSSLAKSVVPFSTGTASTIYDGNLYTIRGGTTAFYQYNIEKDSWYLPTAGFFGSNYLGSTNYNFGPGSAVSRDNSQNIYLLRGSFDNTFVRYNTRTGITTQMSSFPTGAYDGASLAYVQSENAIYGIAGNSSSSVFKYDISTNTWTEMENDFLPAASGSGSTIEWDGGQYIYFSRGVSTNTWYRYDLNGTDGTRWSAVLSVNGLSGITFGAGSEAVIKSGVLYRMRGLGTMTFYSIDLANAVSGTWNALASLPTSPSPFTATTVAGDAFLVDGNDGYLYLAKGNSTSEFYRYSISGNSWSRVVDIPSIIYAGTTNGGANSVSIGERIFVSPGNTAGVGTYNDGLLTYIGQTTNTSFVEEGVYTSDSIDLTKNYNWANLVVASSTQTNTNVNIETSSSNDDLTWSSWSNVSNEKLINGANEYVINSPVGRYVKVRITLNSTDGIYSPVVDSLKINYYKDETAPSNPQAVFSAKSKEIGGVDLVSGEWANTVEPYFTLPTEDAENGATDGVGGAGVDCYFVYFGTDINATPSTLSQCSNNLNYKFSPSENGETYYLLVQTRDRAGNTQGEIKQLFNMKLDINAPTDPQDLNVNPEGYTNIDNFTFTMSDPANDPETGLEPMIQYRTGGDLSGTWFDIPSGELTVTIPNAEHPEGKYRAGVNEFFVRVKDSAGNVSSGTKMVQYKFGAVAPSPPQNLLAIPEQREINEFSFSWNPPASYIGDVNNITYYYSVNSEPGPYNTNSTMVTSVGPGSFATQKGENNFYVVAKDEAGNIDYKQYAKIPFIANTSAPSSPTYLNVSDISDKESAQFRLVLSWMAPDIGDENNFAGYDIYESEDEEGDYAKIANTSGTAYVHTNLERDSVHYYYVVAVDKTQNKSAASSVSSAIATGRYKNPPNIVKEPEVVARATTATIKWATSREANSAVQFGVTEELGQNISNPLTTYVTDHEVSLTGLYPETTYHFKAVYQDPDGNIGYSEMGSFVTAPAPKVSGLKVEDVRLDSMLITWESNVPSYGSIVYGETQNMASSVEEDPYYVKKHTVKLSDLDDGTTYYFQIKALDEEGNLFTSDIYEESTLPMPKISNVKFQNKTEVDSPTVIISYETNVETSTIVSYSTPEVKTKEYLKSALVKKHEVEISDLQPLKYYTISVSGRDKFGNAAMVENHNITTLSDTMPPKIITITDQKKVIGEGGSAETQLTVKVVTNEDSIAVVEAAKGAGSTAFNINSNTTSTASNHTISMKLGEPGIPYTYRVKVKDSAGNETISEIKTLVVSSPRKSALEYIVSVFSRNFGWLGGIFE